MEEVSTFNNFFRLSIHASAAKIQPDKVVFSDVAKMAIFLRPIFSASGVQHISDMQPSIRLKPNFERNKIFKINIYSLDKS